MPQEILRRALADAGLTPEDGQQLRLDLVRHETVGGNIPLVAYPDTEGVWTIGIGHTRGVTPGTHASTEEVELWYAQDVEAAAADAKKFSLIGSGTTSFWGRLDSVRRLVLVNMAFNLGYARLVGFRGMKAGIIRGDYYAAYREMLDSKWATQVKGRAWELAARMLTGISHPHHP